MTWQCITGLFLGWAFCLRPLKQVHDALPTSLLLDFVPICSDGTNVRDHSH